MIPYLDRDLLRAFFLSFLTILSFVLLGYFVAVILEKNRFIFGGEESKLGWVLLYYIATLPRQASFTIPVATALAVLFVYTVKARQNELLAYMAGGISPSRLAVAYLLVGLVFSIGGFFLIEFVANGADRFARRIERINIEGRSLEGLTREQNVFQRGEGNRFFSIRSFDPATEKMQLPMIIDTGEDWSTINWRLDAHRAERQFVNGIPQWVFYDAQFRRWDEAGTIVEYLDAPILRESDLDGVQLEERLIEYLRERFRPDQSNFYELIEYIRVFQEQGKPTYRLETYLFFNFAIPAGAFVLTILMCGHILRPSSTGVVVGFGGGLVWVAAYYVALIGARQAALTGSIPPLAAAIAPNLLFLLLGIYLLRTYRAA